MGVGEAAEVRYSLEMPSILRDAVVRKRVHVCGPTAFTASGFNSAVDSGDGWRPRSRGPVLSSVYVPVVDSNGDVIAVIHGINRNGLSTFSNSDVKMLSSLAGRVTAAS